MFQVYPHSHSGTCYIVDHDIFIICNTCQWLVSPSFVGINDMFHLQNVVCNYSVQSNRANAWSRILS
jgi:hypothetical protein